MTPEKSIYLSKLFGGLTVCVAALAITVLKSHHYLAFVVLLMAGISVYFRLTAGDEKLKSNTIYLLIGIGVASIGFLLIFFLNS